MLESFSAAFLVGLLGAGHCFGMCGGITAALSFAIENPSRRRVILIAYNVGRILSYSLIGLFAGVVGLGVMKSTMHIGQFPILRLVAAIMLVLMGLYLTGWWKILTHLEKAGAGIWRYIQPYAQKFLPVKTIPQAFVVGMLWGWLPCGLVYSALVFAAATAHPLNSALVMLAFGLGTFPAVFLGGLAGNQLKSLLQQRALQIGSGLLLIVFGLWTAYLPFQHVGHQKVPTSAETHTSPSPHRHDHDSH